MLFVACSPAAGPVRGRSEVGGLPPAKTSALEPARTQVQTLTPIFGHNVCTHHQASLQVQAFTPIFGENVCTCAPERTWADVPVAGRARDPSAAHVGLACRLKGCHGVHTRASHCPIIVQSTHRVHNFCATRCPCNRPTPPPALSNSPPNPIPHRSPFPGKPNQGYPCIRPRRARTLAPRIIAPQVRPERDILPRPWPGHGSPLRTGSARGPALRCGARPGAS